ncbi:MAG: acetyl-CoA carboxylase [Pseudomonadota bacterium]
MAKVTVAAPSAGVVYRRPSPEEDPFVSVGDVVAAGQVVCLVEIMKTFAEVKTEAGGKVTEVNFEDEQFVAEGDPLVVIETD